MTHRNSFSLRAPQRLRDRVADWLGLRPTSHDLVETISGLSAEITVLNQTIAAGQARVAALQEQLDRLEKQQARSGKEQYKANLHAETQQQTIKDLLNQLREDETFRERELSSLRERLTNARAEGRMDMIQQIFTVLDGLDEAIANGRRWLEQPKEAPAPPAPFEPAPKPRFFWERLLAPSKFETPPRPVQAEERPEDASRMMDAWLDGLELIRRRLLDVLAAQNIQAVETEHEMFNPRLHVVVDIVPAQNGYAPEQIVATQRRGFVRGETVVRYAEVVVAR